MILPIQNNLPDSRQIGLQDMRLALIHSFAIFIVVSSQTIMPLSPFSPGL